MQNQVNVSLTDNILMRFAKYLRDENRKPGVLSENELKELIEDFLTREKSVISTFATKVDNQKLLTDHTIRFRIAMDAIGAFLGSHFYKNVHVDLVVSELDD